MALASTTVLEVRTTGSDLNGGGYNPSRSVNGVDRSQQDAAHVVIDGVTISSVAGPASANITLTGYTVSNSDLGNLLNIGGVAFEITAVNTGSNYWTLDRTTGASVDTPLTGRMGGALATPGKAAAVAGTNNSVWVREGDYPVTTTSPNVSGGVVSISVPEKWRGYQSTRGDHLGSVVMRASGIASATLFTVGAAAHDGCYLGLTFDGASLAGINGFSGGSARGIFRRLVAKRCVTGLSGSGFTQSYAESCSGVGITGANLFECESKSCGTGFLSASPVRCIAWGNTGDGFGPISATQFVSNCVAAGNTGAGFSQNTGAWQITIENCIASQNTGAGFSIVTAMGVVKRCASYSNGVANSVASNMESDAIITLTADPFTNAASGNFALNSTAGGGAACKAAGIPGAFPGGTTTGYLDIGAAQSQASTAGYPRGVNL